MMSIRSGLVALASLVLLAPLAGAQEGDRVAAMASSLKTSMAALRHYEWIETSTTSMNGEEKAKSQNRCYYDAEGKLTKVATGGGTEGGGKKGGIRGKAAENKKAEIAASMKAAVAMVHDYLPPDPARIQTAKEEGKLAIRPTDKNGRAGVDIKDYRKPGDLLTIEMDANTNHILKAAVSSYETAKDKDPVEFEATFKALPDGTIHTATTTFHLKSQGVTVKIENTGYKKS